jgi:hypothetical protein
MAGLADILSKGSGSDADMAPGDDAEGGGSAKEMAVASVKAFFEAGTAGDFDAAAEHLSAAMEHCEDYENEGESGGGHGALIVAVPHKK